MKEFKGTPGPWTGKDVGICKQDDAGLQLGFIMTSDEERREECAANAQLISASPDLLAALQSLVEIYDNDGSRLYTTETKQRALDKAKVAIDKALGE